MLSSSYTPAVITYSSLFKSYGCLDVFIPDTELLLCMKLIAFREKDADDILRMIEIIEEKSGAITINKINEWYDKYYEKFGKKPKFKKDAVQFIKETFK